MAGMGPMRRRDTLALEEGTKGGGLGPQNPELSPQSVPQVWENPGILQRGISVTRVRGAWGQRVQGLAACLLDF